MMSVALCALPAQASMNVLTCEPEWAALVGELAGDKASVNSATTALQDPHRIEARPSLIAKARNADLLVCTGLDLEVGWLPILLQQSGNNKIAVGKAGHFMAGSFVSPLDVPTKLDRADGDVHAAGNPHIQQDPHNIEKVAEALSKRLAEIDNANASYYQGRYKDFSTRWSAAEKKWEQQAASLKGVAVVEHHKNMAYLLNWLGLRSVATLEPKPGVEPSASHLAALQAQLQKAPAKIVLRAAYQDDRASKWLVEHASVKAVVVPFSVGADDKSKDLFGMFDVTVQRLLEGVK
ncbi:MAG: zinc ABC transporter substrate-binding protein [Burkholderiales bacterium]|nr:zinc ABC transporter substrate-binding protein [Burkholderiales bacterium]